MTNNTIAQIWDFVKSIPSKKSILSYSNLYNLYKRSLQTFIKLPFSHTLSIDPNVHFYDSCQTKNLILFTPNIKLNTFTFVSFSLSGTQTRGYGPSIVLKLPP